MLPDGLLLVNQRSSDLKALMAHNLQATRPNCYDGMIDQGKEAGLPFRQEAI
jgi:hypothetical protein